MGQCNCKYRYNLEIKEASEGNHRLKGLSKTNPKFKILLLKPLRLSTLIISLQKRMSNPYSQITIM